MPQTIGRYQIIELLGDGGMASVYRAYDPHFDREVAVKVIAAHFMHNDELRERFKQEAKVIASLEHPAIVPVYDFGEENGQPFLVMRLMKGGSLNDWLAKGELPLNQAVDLLQRLAPALDKAHRLGIVHRDIKPDNILFDDANHPYISDFGIAKLIEETSLGLTGTGNPIGSPPYMSPEQARGLRQVDGRSDIYSLGILLFELLAGQRPYQADSLFGYIHQHLNEPVPNIRDIKPTLPEACQNVILRALAKQPTQRYSSAGEMVAELKTITGTQSPKPSSPPWALLAGGLGGLFILCSIIMMFSDLGGILGSAATPTFTQTSTSTPTLPPTSTSTPTLPPTSTPEPTLQSTSITTPIPEVTPNANTIAHLERADAFREESQHEQAIAEYTEVIRLDPNNAKAYFGRGFSHQKRGEFDLAIANYNDAIRLNSDYVEAYNRRGLAYRGQGEPELAIADFTQAIGIDPDYTLAYGNRASTYEEQGELDLAIDDCTEAIRLDPDFTFAYLIRGIAYRKQDQLELAIADYSDAIRLNPDYTSPYNHRGLTYEKNEQRELAIADYRKVLELDNNQDDTDYAKGRLKGLGVEP